MAKFFSRNPDEPVRSAGVYNPETGETESVQFTDGVLETDNPIYIAALSVLASDPAHPIGMEEEAPPGESEPEAPEEEE